MSEQAELISDKRIFLGWEKPILHSLVDHLLLRRDELPGLMVVVPTAETGRRLARGLAERGVVKGPECVTPTTFFANSELSRISEQVGWQELASRTDWSRYDDLLPDPVAAPPDSVRGLIGHVRSVRAELVEFGLDIATASKRLPDDHPELPRWKALASLESDYRALIRSLDLTDPQDLKSRTANTYSLPPGTKELVIACVPDPVPLSVHCWERLSRSVRISVLVHAPESHAAHFDDWGRPSSGYWATTKIDVGSDRKVVICEQAADQGEAAVQSISQLLGERVTLSAADIALGVCDRDILPEVSRVFADNDWTLFDPGGRTLGALGVLQWLGLLSDWFSNGEVKTLQSLLPQHWTGCLVGKPTYEATRSLSGIVERFLPQSTEEVLGVSRRRETATDLVAIVEQLQEMEQTFRRDGAASTLKALLAAVLPDQQELLEACDDVLEEIAMVERKVDLGPWQWLQFFISSASGIRMDEKRSGPTLDAQGWLELATDPAPDVIVTGFNEGFVPESQLGDPWLSNNMRVALGLKANRSRLSRDAYLTTSLVESRRAGGSVTFICGRWTSTGEGMLPSRLLLKPERNQLAERVLHAFRPPSVSGKAIPWHRDWMLEVPEAPLPRTFGTTSLRDYLTCPTRYYLKHVLKLSRPEHLRVEWTAAGFGNVVHQVLESFGADPNARQLEKANAIHEWLSTELDRVVGLMFREVLPLAVEIQIDSIRQRLRTFAFKQAEQRAAGWEICYVEKRMQLEIDGQMVTGVIDRVDYNSATDQWMIWDYKTGKGAQDPVSAHCSAVTKTKGPADHLQDDERFVFDAPAQTKTRPIKPHFWNQLQLPLYAEWLGREEGVKAGVGYISISAVASEVGFYEWEDYSEEIQAAAVLAAEATLEKLTKRVFWPPAESVKYDDFEDWADGESLAAALKPFGNRFNSEKPDNF